MQKNYGCKNIVLLACITFSHVSFASENAIKDVVNPNETNPTLIRLQQQEKDRIIASLQQELDRLGNGKITSCDKVVTIEYQGGRDAYFGAICTITNHKKEVQALMCDDDMVGKFTLTLSFIPTRGNMRNMQRFIEFNCPPGG